MADYWKSNPRKFCEFCKCWIADNKPSREFHEKGKNHQENVRLKINAAMKKGIKKAEEEQEMADTMKQIEMAAFKALKKDLTKDPSMAAQYGVKLKPKETPVQGPCNLPESERQQLENDSTDTSTSTDKSQDTDPNKKSTANKEDPNEVWKEEWTPEGFVYYWHIHSGESVWVKPEGYTPTWERAAQGEAEEEVDDIEFVTDTDNTEGEEQQKEQPLPTDSEQSQREQNVPALDPDSGEASDDSVPEKTESGVTSVDENKKEPDVRLSPIPISDIPLPGDIPLPPDLPPPAPKEPEPEDSDPEEPEVPAQRISSARLPAPAVYGTWETVEEAVEQPPIDLQLPPSTACIEVKSIPITEPKIKFRQKKVDTLGAEFVAFKKRKMNSGRSSRTTDTEKSGH